MDDNFLRMASNANWTDVKVSYKFSSLDDSEIKTASIGTSLLTYFILVMMTLGVVGTILELTRLGDISNLDYKRLDKMSRFESIK
jgi:hypothetical protein